MKKYIENFDLLRESTVNSVKYQLRLAMVEDGSIERKFKIIEVEDLTYIVTRSVMFKRSNYKTKVEQFVQDSLLNLSDKEIDEVMETVKAKMVSKEIKCIKTLIENSKWEVYENLCDYVREHEIEIITEIKDGYIRIWDYISEDILKEISEAVSLEDMLNFLVDNNLLKHDKGRKKVHISKSKRNPEQGWAYCFKDYKNYEGDAAVA